MNIKKIRPLLVGGTICLLLMMGIPSTSADFFSFHDATVLITGKCNTSYVIGFSWILGAYIPILKRHIVIRANNGTGESITVMVLKSGSGRAVFTSHSEINIDLLRARGVFFWGGKSLIGDKEVPASFFAFCRAGIINIQTN